MSDRPVHYFDDHPTAAADILLGMMTRQGYVPRTCLLAGFVVFAEVNAGRDPCKGCSGPRELCHGRPRESAE